MIGSSIWQISFAASAVKFGVESAYAIHIQSAARSVTQRTAVKTHSAIFNGLLSFFTHLTPLSLGVLIFIIKKSQKYLSINLI